jgi:hypothetical protein
MRSTSKTLAVCAERSLLCALTAACDLLVIIGAAEGSQVVEIVAWDRAAHVTIASLVH